MAKLIWTAALEYYLPSDEIAFFGWSQSISGF